MQKLSWLISCGLALFGVMLIQYFYQLKSETGNLGIVGLALVTPFVLLCLFITVRYFYTIGASTPDRLSLFIYLSFGVLFIGALTYFALEYKSTVFTELGGNRHDPNSAIYNEPFLNAETSKIYFNFYSVMILIATTAVIATVIGLFKRTPSA